MCKKISSRLLLFVLSITAALIFGAGFWGLSFAQTNPLLTGREGMIYIPPGPFLMGNNASYDDQKPEHEIYLDGFWIDRYEVSNAEFVRFLVAMGNQVEKGGRWIELSPNSRIREINGTYKIEIGYENHPVVNVTWYGAQAYARWAGKRLPTEAQWEKAASWNEVSKKKRKWPWGDKWNKELLNCWEGIHQFTTPVNSYPDGASSYEIQNMAGNLWEWCADWYAPQYYKVSPYKNPKGPGKGDYRLIRGGSWTSYRVFATTTYRGMHSPGSGSFDVGFRCAR